MGEGLKGEKRKRGVGEKVPRDEGGEGLKSGKNEREGWERG